MGSFINDAVFNPLSFTVTIFNSIVFSAQNLQLPSSDGDVIYGRPLRCNSGLVVIKWFVKIADLIVALVSIESVVDEDAGDESHKFFFRHEHLFQRKREVDPNYFYRDVRESNA